MKSLKKYKHQIGIGGLELSDREKELVKSSIKLYID